MIVHVTSVRVVGPHSLELAFDNGVRKRVNLRRELYGQVFEALRDPAQLARAYLDADSGTVAYRRGLRAGLPTATGRGSSAGGIRDGVDADLTDLEDL